MLPLFIAALANVTSLGVIVPLLPFQAEGAGAGPAAIAWLFAVYSLTQFLTAPLWGRAFWARWASCLAKRKPWRY